MKLELTWDELTATAPWAATLQGWELAAGLAGAVAGGAVVADWPVTGLVGGMATGLLGVRVSRTVGTARWLNAVGLLVLAVAAAWGLEAAAAHLIVEYRLDLRPPSLRQWAVVGVLTRGLPGLVASVPALLQWHTRRWRPGAVAGFIGGSAAGVLLWPALRVPGAGSELTAVGRLIQIGLWAGTVLACLWVGEALFARLPRIRRSLDLAAAALLTTVAVIVSLGVAQPEPLLAAYSCDGPVFYSFSPDWAEEARLSRLCAALQKHPHADEWSRLDRVVLLPGAGSFDVSIQGRYYGEQERGGNGAVIELYFMETRATIADVVPVLSHEYGHHFAEHHLFRLEGLTWEAFLLTEWAAIRGLTDVPRVGAPDGPYHLRAAEIAAEDYVALFAPGARRDTGFREAWRKAGIPQPEQLPALREYWERAWSER